MTFGDALAERAWYGDDAGSRALSGALVPLGVAFGAVARMRGAMYRAGVLRSHQLALPAVSVGNLTVGGTGKTPVAAWIAGRLLARGARPAVVLRGYGGDEPLAHELLNPEAIVVADRDRVAAVKLAAARGATVAVLADAFQHRRARRDVDLVLVSADQWNGAVRSLPAGPWREPLSALRRATTVVITRKAASRERLDDAQAAIERAAPDVPVAVVSLAADGLRGADGASAALGMLASRRVLAISAIGDPRAFHRQLEAAGAAVDAATFGDHHAFSRADVTSLVARASRAEVAVCTLKDAVKLWPLWPRGAAPLWYVSQHVTVEIGAAALDASLDLLVPNSGR